MVNVSAEVAAGATPPKEASKFAKLRQRFNRSTAKQPSVPSVEMKRNEFVNKSGSDAELSRREKRRGGTESEYATFKGETIKQYTHFLDNYLKNLLELNKNHPTILNQPAHAHERRLLEMLTESGSPSADKIKQWIESPHGMATTTQLLEQQTAIMLFGLGLDADARWNVDGQRVSPTTLINAGRTGIRREGMARLAHIMGVDYIGRWHGAPGAAIGAVVGGGVGLGAGAVGDVGEFIFSLGATNPAALGVIAGAGLGGALANRFFRPEGDIDLHGCAEALGIIKNNPDNIAYLKALTGIDANDFIVNAAGDVAFDPARTIIETPHIADARRQIIQNIHTRRAFYESLGYPHARRGEAAEQLYTRYNDNGDPQLQTRWYLRMQDLLHPNDPAYLAMTPEQRREAYMQAQQQVMTEYINDYYTLVHGGRSHEAPISAMKETVKKGKEGGKAKWEESQQKKIDALETDRKYLEEQGKKLFGEKGSDDQDYAKFEEEKKRISDEYALDFKDDVVVNRSIEESIQHRQDLLRKKGTFAGIKSLNQLRADALRTLRAVERANPPINQDYQIVDPQGGIRAGTQLAENPILTHAKERYAAEMEGINQLKTEIRDEISVLKSLLDRQKGANEAIAKVQSEAAGYGGFVESSQRAFVAFTRPGILTQADLANLSVDELLQRINAYHTANLTDTTVWSEADNNNALNRERLVQASIEAKSAEASLSTNIVNETMFYRLIAYQGLTERQLVGASNPDDILTILNNKNAANPNIGWPATSNDLFRPMIEAAVEAAKLRTSLRRDAFDVMRVDIETSKTTAEIAKSRFKEHPNIQRIEAIVDLADRQGNIFSASTDGNRNLQELFEENLALVTDNLTNAEKTLLAPTLPAGVLGPPAPTVNIPRGYYRFLDYLFAYQNKGGERGEYFQKIQSVLGPDRFAQLANDALHLAVAPGPGGVVTAQDVMNAIHHEVINGLITQRQLRQLGTHIIDQLIEQGNALSL